MSSILSNLFGRTVLVCSHDRETRDLISGAFQSFRCKVILANDDEAAARQIQTNDEIDFALYDVGGPIEKGIAFLQRIPPAALERVPFFFVTDRADEPLEEAFINGAEGVFNKPLHFDELVKGVAFTYGIIQQNAHRQFRRQRIRNARARVTAARGQNPLSGFVTNISAGGMFISSWSILPPANQVVDFKIEFGDDETIEVTGQAIVRWLRPFREFGRPPGVGLEFTSLDEETLEKLRKISDRKVS